KRTRRSSVFGTTWLSFDAAVDHALAETNLDGLALTRVAGAAQNGAVLGARDRVAALQHRQRRQGVELVHLGGEALAAIVERSANRRGHSLPQPVELG